MRFSLFMISVIVFLFLVGCSASESDKMEKQANEIYDILVANMVDGKEISESNKKKLNDFNIKVDTNIEAYDEDIQGLLQSILEMSQYAEYYKLSDETDKPKYKQDFLEVKSSISHYMN